MIEHLDTVMVVVGTLTGFILGRRERNLRAPIVYRCDCRHSLAMHTDKGRCKGSSGNCTCQQYVGHRPVYLAGGSL